LKPKISVILPTLEEQAIFRVVKDVRRLLGNDTEIIIVGRGSEDYFAQLDKLNVKVLRQKRRGLEKALLMGFNAATGEILATTDADGTHGSEGLPKGVRLVSEGKADFVLGNRMGSIQKEAMSSYLQFGNSALSNIFNIFYGTHVHDVLTGLFVTKREVFDKIKRVRPYRTGIAFFAAEVAKRGYSLDEVDIKYYIRKYGSSQLTKSKLLWGIRAAVFFILHSR